MATVTWNALNDSSWSGPTNWDSTAVPTSADAVLFNSTSIKNCIVDIDATISSFTATTAYTGNITATGKRFVCPSGFSDDGGGGSRDYGIGINCSGASSTLHFGSTLGAVTATSCNLSMTGTTNMTFDDDTGCVFRSLNIGANGRVTSTGSALTTFRGSSIVLFMGTTSKFTQNSNISYEPTSSGEQQRVLTGMAWDGTGGNVYWKLQTPGQSLSFGNNSDPFIYNGTGNWYLTTSGDGIDGTYTLGGGGPFSLANVPQLHVYTDKSNANIFVNNSGSGGSLTLTSGRLFVGSSNAHSTFSASISNTAGIGSFDGTTYDVGPTNLTLNNQIFNCTGNWTYGTHTTVTPGTSTTNFKTNSATVTSNSGSFGSLNFTQATKTWTIADPLTCINLTVGSSAAWTCSGASVTSSGNVSFDSTGTINLGNGVTMTGASKTLHIGSTTTVLTASSCSLIFSNTGMVFDDKSGGTYRALTLSPSASVTISGTQISTFSDATSPITLGSGASLTNSIGSTVIVSSSSNIMSLPASYTLNGTTGYTLKTSGSIAATLPTFTYTGSGTTTIGNVSGDSTVSLGGNFSSTGPLTVVNTTPSSKLTFNTSGYDCTTTVFTSGCSQATGTYVANYGSSKMVISTFIGAANNSGTINQNLSTSLWAVSGATWSYGSVYVVDPGTSLVTFTAAATITSAKKAFYDLRFNNNFLRTFPSGSDVNCHNLISSEGGLTLTGAAVNASGNMSLTTVTGATYILGTGITMSGNSQTWSINSNGSTITSTTILFSGGGNCSLNCTNPPTTIFNSLTVNAGTNLTTNGSIQIGQPSNVLPALSIGSDTTFVTNNTAGQIFAISYNGPGTIWSLGANSKWDGTIGGYIYVNGAGTAIGFNVPTLNYYGTGLWKFDGTNDTYNLTGNLNLISPNTTLQLVSTTFNTQNHNVTCGKLQLGARGNYGFGSAIVNCTTYDATTLGGAGTYNLATSTVNCSGNCSLTSTATFNATSSTFNFTGPSTIISNGKNFNDVTGNAPGNLITASGALSCNSLNIVDASWSNTGTSVTAAGKVYFNGTGSMDLGNSVTMTGVDSTFQIGPSTGPLTTNLCALTMNGTTGTAIDIRQDATFQSLTLGAAAKTTSIGAGNVILAKTSTPLTLGNTSALTLNGPMTLQLNATGTAISLPASYTLKGNSVLSLDTTVANSVITVPATTITGTLGLGLLNANAIDSTRQLSGTFNSTGDLFLHNANTGTLTFYSQNNSITARNISLGSDNASGTFRSYFGSSIVAISNDVNPTSYNSGNNTIYMYKSLWTVGRNWTCPTSHLVLHAWDSATFTGDSTITSSGEFFNWVYFNAPGHRVTLADNFVCREYKTVGNTLLTKNGSFAAVQDHVSGIQVSNRS